MKKDIKLKSEQEEAIFFDNGNLILSASAGSGKTFVMINRIIWLIESGKAEVKDILAVTFTKASAEDMKLKLQEAIIEAYNEAKDEETAKRFSAQIADMATANISTLHSFCSRLIKRYSALVNIPSDFKNADEAYAKKLKYNAVNKLFKKLYIDIKTKDENDNDYPGYFIDLCNVFFQKRNDANLKKLVIGIYNFADTEANRDEFLERAKSVYTLQNKSEVFKSAFSGHATKVRKYAEQLEKTKQNLASFKHGSAFCDYLEGFIKHIIKVYENPFKETYEDYKTQRLNFEKKAPEEDRELVKAIHSDVKKIINEFMDFINFCDDNEIRECAEHTENLVRLVKEFGEFYRQEKEEEGVVDFNDLEHLSLAILSNEEARKEIQEEFKYVFVDECQDINGAQDAIIKNLSNGNLFRVGDVKQSIYGFRGCRPEIFKEEFESGIDKKEAKRLSHNFRSAPAIINAVNEVFDYAMAPGRYNGNYKDERLLYGNEELCKKGYEGHFHYYRLISETPEEENEDKIEKPRIYSVLENIDKPSESEKIAPIAGLLSEIIKNNLRAGKNQDSKEKDDKDIDITDEGYYFKEGEAPHKITYGDIAIIVRDMRDPIVHSIVTGLSNNDIPVVSTVEQMVCEFAEVKVLINVLQLIECYDNDIPLASVLYSPIGNFSLEELYKIASFANEKLGGIDRFYQAYCYYRDKVKDELSEKILKFEEYFNNIRFLSEFKSAEEILDKVILDNNLEAYWLANINGAETIRRVRAFISASVNDMGNMGVKEFLDYIEKSGDEILLNSSDATDDAVKVMTMHSSKGLEFPVVIVCRLEKDLIKRTEKTAEITLDRENCFVLKTYDKKTKRKYENVISKYFKEKKYEKIIADETRLFYVALTRAKYSLYAISENQTSSDKGEFKKFVDFMPPSMKPEEKNASDYLAYYWDKSHQKLSLGSGGTDVTTAESEKEALKKNFDFKYEYDYQTGLPLKTSVTAVVSEFNKNNEKKFDSKKGAEFKATQPTVTETENSTLEQEVESEVKESGGTVTDVEKGIIAHKILELTDFNKDFDEQIDELIRNGNFKDLIREQVDLEKIKKGEDIVKIIKEKVDLDKIKNCVNSIKEKVGNGKTYREKSFLCNFQAKDVREDYLDEEKQNKKGYDTPILVQGVIDLLVIENGKAKVIDYKYSHKDEKGLIETYSKQLELYAKAVEKGFENVEVVETVIISLVEGKCINVNIPTK